MEEAVAYAADWVRQLQSVAVSEFGRTTTEAPSVLIKQEKEAFFGLPAWAFGGMLTILGLFACFVPLLFWLRRQQNIRKPYMPNEAPDIDGFVNEVVGRADASGVLYQSRLARN
eukprot:gnl/TRDRNA2_/TRDRNA2_66539_c0_seq1.p2 gnl/TRDRNA2_/TRDRNA2_66539_c0~~gnl/TRDRNA2_/TRDRNA2_66539_c0_seq1.p2  ORF type:complete len:114 (+),score=18.91 gnl/TRDRNA2_/TRDRNA2_66539_c0_seq1:156-497(+)